MRPLLFVQALVVFAASSAAAQSVRGTAWDSLAGAPLVGARVWVRGHPGIATTDSAGRFVMDGLPPGRQLIVLDHPSFEEIGITGLGKAVTLDSGRTIEVAIATPSLGTIWHRLCGTSVLGVDSGIVFGTVRDEERDVLLARSMVRAGWQSLYKTGAREVQLQDRAENAWSDSTGTYALCGLATGTTIYLTALAGSRGTAESEIVVGRRFVARHDFSMLGADSADGVMRPTGRAALTGTVRRIGGVPVTGALVSIASIDSTQTSDSGRFSLWRLPPGTQWLRIRAIGYAPVERSVHLRSGDTLRLDVEMSAAVLIDSINVNARRGWAEVELEEFQHRKRNAIAGQLFDETDLRRYNQLRAVFIGLPSTDVRAFGGQWAVTFRYLTLRGTSNCAANVIIDGRPGLMEELLSMQPNDLLGLEVYPRASEVPIRYQPDARQGCGLIIVWTKRMR
jgi:hypothetical protein